MNTNNNEKAVNLSNKIVVEGSLFKEPIVIEGAKLIKLFDSSQQLIGFIKFIDPSMFIVASSSDEDWEQAKALAGLSYLKGT